MGKICFAKQPGLDWLVRLVMLRRRGLEGAYWEGEKREVSGRGEEGYLGVDSV